VREKTTENREPNIMRFFSRKFVKPQDLNSSGNLFGGAVLAWIDEEAGIFATCQLGKKRIVTKYMSEIDFVSSGKMGDIVEIGTDVVSLGRTSVTLRCEVRNKITKQTIIKVDKIVFVHIDENGNPQEHGVTEPNDDWE
jgi:acyl-CoA thioesterase YciA